MRSTNLGLYSRIRFRHLGHLGKTLIVADSPNKMMGLATLKKAIAQREALMGGWDKIVILGWNFETYIGESIINNDPLALIEYWAIDPNYDGVLFGSLYRIIEAIMKALVTVSKHTAARVYGRF